MTRFQGRQRTLRNALRTSLKTAEQSLDPAFLSSILLLTPSLKQNSESMRGPALSKLFRFAASELTVKFFAQFPHKEVALLTPKTGKLKRHHAHAVDCLPDHLSTSDPFRFAKWFPTSHCNWTQTAKSTRIAVLFGWMLAVSASGGLAQTAMNLDMSSVASLARSHNWVSKQAHQDATTAGAVAKKTASMRWGRVDFQSQYLRFNDPIEIHSPIPPNLVPVLGLSSLTTPVAPQDNLHVDLAGGVPLFMGGKITNAIREANAGAKAAVEVANDTDNDVVLTAERSYLSVLLTREVVKLNESALQAYKEHLEHASPAFRQGTAAKYDEIRAETAVAEQEKRLTEATNQSALAEAALRTSLALNDSVPVEINGHLFEITDAVDLNQAMNTAVQSSPILKALNQKLAVDRSSIRVQEADYLPR